MPSNLESRLGELFAQLPEPGHELGEQALARALGALPAPQRSPRPIRALVLVLGVGVVLLAVAAGALAAAGALHVSLGRPAQRTPRSATTAVAQLSVPRGALGTSATVDGRLWLTTASGLRLEGLPVTAAALSPHALYVAAGIGHSLVTMAPSGRRAWSHPVPGTVAAIAWAPDGLRIAYIVETAGRFRLYAIEGNGRRNRLVDGAVRPTAPAWRGDSRALAYVAAGGHPVVYDFGHDSHTSLAAPAARNARFLGFRAAGAELAIATAHSVLVTTGHGRPKPQTFAAATVAGIGWLRNKLAVALNQTAPPAGISHVSVYRLAPNARLVEVDRVNEPATRIQALDAWNTRLTLALRSRSSVSIVSTAGTSLANLQAELLRLPASSRVGNLDAR
jgi:hypothetical protein